MLIFLFSLNIYFCFFLAFIFIFLLPILIKKNKKLIIAYFFVYLFILSLGVFSKISFQGNYIHFYFLSTPNWFNNNFIIAHFDNFMVFINLFLTFPIGVIFHYLYKTDLNKTLLLGILFSLSIELLQLTLPIIRTPELLDILTNTIGTILGFYYCLILKKFQTTS